MTHRQHLTTRRSFIATVGFGGIALYGAWAAYGAAPLPFATGGGHTEPSHQPEVPAAHGGHGTQQEAPAAPGGHGMPGATTPEEFTRRHEEFTARFQLADGSVMPKPEGCAADACRWARGARHDARDPARREDRTGADRRLPPRLSVRLYARRASNRSAGRTDFA